MNAPLLFLQKNGIFYPSQISQPLKKMKCNTHRDTRHVLGVVSINVRIYYEHSITKLYSHGWSLFKTLSKTNKGLPSETFGPYFNSYQNGSTTSEALLLNSPYSYSLCFPYYVVEFKHSSRETEQLFHWMIIMLAKISNSLYTISFSYEFKDKYEQ